MAKIFRSRQIQRLHRWWRVYIQTIRSKVYWLQVNDINGFSQGSSRSLKSCFPLLPKLLNPKSCQSQKLAFDFNLKSTKANLQKSGSIFGDWEKFWHFFGLLPRDWTKIGGIKWKDRSFYLTNGIFYQNSMRWNLLGSLYGF